MKLRRSMFHYIALSYPSNFMTILRTSWRFRTKVISEHSHAHYNFVGAFQSNLSTHCCEGCDTGKAPKLASRWIYFSKSHYFYLQYFWRGLFFVRTLFPVFFIVLGLLSLEYFDSLALFLVLVTIKIYSYPFVILFVQSYRTYMKIGKLLFLEYRNTDASIFLILFFVRWPILNTHNLLRNNKRVLHNVSSIEKLDCHRTSLRNWFYIGIRVDQYYWIFITTERQKKIEAIFI